MNMLAWKRRAAIGHVRVIARNIGRERDKDDGDQDQDVDPQAGPGRLDGRNGTGGDGPARRGRARGRR